MEDAPKNGLKWIKRRASETPVWVASAAEYKPRTVNLSHLRDSPDQLAAKAAQLQAEMNAWKAGLKDAPQDGFDGSVKSLLKRYQTDPDSPYFALRPGSRHPYDHYIQRLVFEIGERKVAQITGIDLKRWHHSWSDDGERLAASKMMRSILDAAVSFGIMCRVRECIELREVLKAASRKLPSPKRRETVITQEQVVALRKAAHDDGHPSCALAYSLVFETTLRLWDVIGQWWPMDAPVVSDVVSGAYKKKWLGLRWADIDEDLVLRYMPSKTSAKTGISVTYPLAKAPMVMEELAHWPAAARVGPMIVRKGSGLPYLSNRFARLWRDHAEAAGIPRSYWARDLRASGITEGRAAGGSTDDAAKVAGHAGTKTTAAVYDRANLEAAERFADVRTKSRGVKE